MKKKKTTESMKDEMIEEAKDQAKVEINETNPEAAEHEKKSKKKEEPTPEQLLEEYKMKAEEMNDKYLRLYAEFDNYRKRTLKERIDLIQTSSAEIILALLPVIDDFDRALPAFEQSTDIDALKEGVVLVNNKLRNILGQKGLEEMKSCGEIFNPEMHDAIANAPAPSEDQKGKVIDEVEKGYYLNGKILRHAKVVVGN